MNKEKALEILRLLSNLESVMNMKMFRDQIPSGIIDELDNEILWLFDYIMEIEND